MPHSDIEPSKLGLQDTQLPLVLDSLQREPDSEAAASLQPHRSQPSLARKGAYQGIHRPFTSPVRISSNTTKPAHRSQRLEPDKWPSPTTTPVTPLISPPIPASLPKSPDRRRRLQLRPPTWPAFRSPVRSNSTKRNEGAPCNEFLETRTLLARITELQTTIRNAQTVLKYQEAGSESLLDLIEKWRRVSQEGAMALLKKHSSREEFFEGVEGAFSQSSDYTPQWRRPPSFWWTDEGSDKENKSARSFDREHLEVLGEVMEIQDTQQDLPTVEEALRKREYPDVDPSRPRIASKMHWLLLSLGIDPEVIGYDPDQDMFLQDEP